MICKLKKSLRYMLFATLLTSMLFITSCWDSRDIEELAMVVGMGIDQLDSDEYIVTLQIARPDLLAQGQDGGGVNDVAAVWVLTVRGSSIFQAVNNARDQSPRDIFFGHTQLLVLGEDMAKRGVGPVLDYIQREINMRRTIWVAVAHGEAKNIMEAQPSLAPIPAVGVVGTLGLQQAYSQGFPIRFGDFITQIAVPTAGAIAPIVQLVKNVPEDEEAEEQEIKRTAVFQEDKLIGTLDEIETKGLMWLNGQIEDATIQVQDPVDDQYHVNLDIVRARVDKRAVVKDEKLVLQVRVTSEGRFASQTGPHDLTTPANIKSIERSMATVIEERMKSAMKKSQQLNVDIVEGGVRVSKDLPRVWKELEGDWDHYFPQMELEVAVRALIRKTAAITKPTPYLRGDN